jgi:hypothetical protein
MGKPETVETEKDEAGLRHVRKALPHDLAGAVNRGLSGGGHVLEQG